MRVGLLQDAAEIEDENDRLREKELARLPAILQQCFECLRVQELPEVQACEECGGLVDILRMILRGRTINYIGTATFTAE